MNETIIWPDTHYLTSYIQRLRGITAINDITALSAFWFPHCRAVHTWGMRFPIDVIALDSHGIIIDVKRLLVPNRMYWHKRADTLIELCALCPYPLESWIGAQLQLEARRHDEEDRWATRIVFERV